MVHPYWPGPKPRSQVTQDSEPYYGSDLGCTPKPGSWVVLGLEPRAATTLLPTISTLRQDQVLSVVDQWRCPWMPLFIVSMSKDHNSLFLSVSDTCSWYLCHQHKGYCWTSNKQSWKHSQTLWESEHNDYLCSEHFEVFGSIYWGSCQNRIS
jgi:hypothetical protein